MLTKSQINKINKSMKNGTGTDIKISKPKSVNSKTRWKFMNFIV